MSQPVYSKWKIKFRASKDEELLSALAALDNLHDTDRPEQKKKPAKKKRRRNKGKKADGNTWDDFEYDWPRCVCGMNHPPVPHFKPPDGKKCCYYWQVADMFPFMTIHRVLTSEIKFIEADKDQSGVIELEEMHDLLYKVMGEEVDGKVVSKAFKQIDTDDSGTLDFTEVLTVIDGLVQRKNVNLPVVVKDEFSKICSIQ